MLTESNPSIVYEIFRKPFKVFQALKLNFKIKGSGLNKASFYTVHEGIKKRETLFYVGVHNKEQLYLLHKLAGPSGKLLVFVPTKAIYDDLIRMVEILGWRNVTIVTMTFAVTADEVLLNVQPVIKDIAKNATVLDFKKRKQYKRVQISCVETLDNYCLLHGIYPQFLEIKLPWYELSVLHGAKGILKKYKPKLVIECEERLCGKKNMLEIFKFLTDLNYKGFFILDSIRIPLRNFDFNIYQNPKSDFYCNSFIFE